MPKRRALDAGFPGPTSLLPALSALALMVAACEPAPSADAPPAVSATGATASSTTGSNPGAAEVREGASKEIELSGLQYPTDGVLTLIDQEVSVPEQGAPSTVRAAFCAELTASDAHLRCGGSEGGPVITLAASGTSLMVQGQLLVRTGIGQSLAHSLEATYLSAGDPAALAKESARRWVTRYREGLGRRTHAPPKAVVAVSRADRRAASDRASVIAGDLVFDLVKANELIPEGGTFPVLGASAMTPGRPAARTQLIDESASMQPPLFRLRDAIAWDPGQSRLLVVRGKAGPVEARTVPGGACRSDKDCPGLTLIGYDADARPTILWSSTELVPQSGPAVVGGAVYFLGAAGSEMSVLRVDGSAPPERTKIDLPVNVGAAMTLLQLGADALGAVRIGAQYNEPAVHRFSVAKGKVGAVKKVTLPSFTRRVQTDGHGGMLVSAFPAGGSDAMCKVIALDERGAERWRIEAPQVDGRCPDPEVAADVVSLPKVGWFSWKDGKAIGPKAFAGTSLTRVGELLVACTSSGIGAWTADGAPRATVDLPGGCEQIGVDSRGGVLVVAASAGAYALSPPTAW